MKDLKNLEMYQLEYMLVWLNKERQEAEIDANINKYNDYDQGHAAGRLSSVENMIDDIEEAIEFKRKEEDDKDTWHGPDCKCNMCSEARLFGSTLKDNWGRIE